MYLTVPGFGCMVVCIPALRKKTRNSSILAEEQGSASQRYGKRRHAILDMVQ
jgi:hypothetical protein